MLRSFVAVLVLAVAPVAARAADEENPFKNAKVGDYALYTITTKAAGNTIDGTLTQSVTAKTEKEATVKGVMVFNLGGKEMKFPEQEEKIDLTKPYDPTKGGGANLPGGGEIKAEKDKDGKEKVKVGGKEYDATWTTYKMKAKVMNQEIEADLKVWMAKDVPTGMVKMTMTADIGGQKMEMTMELKETGNNK
jgi:hypothetical protein